MNTVEYHLVEIIDPTNTKQQFQLDQLIIELKKKRHAKFEDLKRFLIYEGCSYYIEVHYNVNIYDILKQTIIQENLQSVNDNLMESIDQPKTKFIKIIQSFQYFLTKKKKENITELGLLNEYKLTKNKGKREPSQKKNLDAALIKSTDNAREIIDKSYFYFQCFYNEYEPKLTMDFFRNKNINSQFNINQIDNKNSPVSIFVHTDLQYIKNNLTKDLMIKKKISDYLISTFEKIKKKKKIQKIPVSLIFYLDANNNLHLVEQFAIWWLNISSGLLSN